MFHTNIVKGTCITMLPSPPTTSPTGISGLNIFYPDYGQPSWNEGFCINTHPAPSGRPTYATMLDCCKSAYGGQVSGKCISMLPSPPTTSPTGVGGLDIFYPDYGQPSWNEGFCINTHPAPSGRPTYATMLDCCKSAYGGQISGKCISMLPSPPTTSPTGVGGLDIFYPDYGQPSWSEGFCINTHPAPSGRPTYATMLDCCKSVYAGQISGKCISMLPSPPTMSPTDGGELDIYYPDYGQPSWSEGFCINTRPLPSGRPTYATMLDCCKSDYAGQISGICLSMLPFPPTTSPTYSEALPSSPTLSPSGGSTINSLNSGGLQDSYPNYDQASSLAIPLSSDGLHDYYQNYDLESSLALNSGSDGLEVYYPNYDQMSLSEGSCINTPPLPPGRPSHGTKQACCEAHYGDQASDTCMCDAEGICYSCRCGSQAERDAAGCPDLICPYKLFLGKGRTRGIERRKKTLEPTY